MSCLEPFPLILRVIHGILQIINRVLDRYSYRLTYYLLSEVQSNSLSSYSAAILQSGRKRRLNGPERKVLSDLQKFAKTYVSGLVLTLPRHLQRFAFAFRPYKRSLQPEGHRLCPGSRPWPF